MGNPSVATQHRVAGIEVARGIAAVFVILLHVSHHIDQAYGTPLLLSAFRFGHAGVDLFFVISGFIILYVHYDDIGNPKQVPRYMRRRLTRILPTYWVAFALTFPMALLGTHALPPATDLAWSAFLLPSDRPMLVGIAWTLRFEMLFYAMFCFVILSRKGFALLALWGGLCAFCVATGTRISFLPDQFQSGFALQFFFGMAVAFLAKERVVRNPSFVLAAGVLLFACAALLENMQVFDGHANFGRFAYGVPASLIILGIATRRIAARSRLAQVMLVVGGASYSIYIFQFIFIGPVWQLLLRSGVASSTTPVEQFLILSSAAILGGVLISRLVEQPLIRLSRALITWNKRKPLTQQYAPAAVDVKT